MKLLTKAILAKLPPLYANEKVADPVAIVKFFCPWSNWTWYATEYNPVERLFFGLVEGHEEELGYFSLGELASIKGPLGLKIERDLHFKPTPLSKLGAAARKAEAEKRAATPSELAANLKPGESVEIAPGLTITKV